MAKPKKPRHGKHNAPKNIDWNYYLIKKKLHETMNKSEIARELGCSPTAVASAMRSRGLVSGV